MENKENKVEEKKEENEDIIAENSREKVELPEESEHIKNLTKTEDISAKDLTWDELGVNDELKKGLLEMGFVKPSKIQTTSFPLIMKEPRKPLIAQGKNGTGKTCAFGLGVLSTIDQKSKDLQAIIFCHTREMINQSTNVLQKMGKYMNIKITPLLAGEEFKGEYGQIILLTPGHFENQFIKKKKKLNTIKIIVLDEADYFISSNAKINPTVKQANALNVEIFKKLFKILEKEKLNPQVLFFSATYSNENKKFIGQYFKEANMITVKKEELTLENIEQYVAYCKTEEEKISYIEKFLGVNMNQERIIIFVNTKKYVIKLQENLTKKGYKVFIIMGGDMDPEERDITIKKFTRGEIQILIATDLLSRGFDEQLVKLVINFDIPTHNNPKEYSTYLHRIGRAGRFGTKGLTLNLAMTEQDKSFISEVQKFFKTTIKEIKGFDEMIEKFKKLDLEE